MMNDMIFSSTYEPFFARRYGYVIPVRTEWSYATDPVISPQLNFDQVDHTAADGI